MRGCLLASLLLIAEVTNAHTTGTKSNSELLKTALNAFPNDTSELEFNNLAALRSLDLYHSLERQYTDKRLRTVQTMLASIGFRSTEIDQLVLGSSRDRQGIGFFGAISLHQTELDELATRKNLTAFKFGSWVAYCKGLGEEVCITKTNGHLLFGSGDGIKLFYAVSRQLVPALNSNANVESLLEAAGPGALVLGFGDSENFPVWTMNCVGHRLPISDTLLAESVVAFAYGVQVQNARSHVRICIKTRSNAAANVLGGVASAVGIVNALPAKLASQVSQSVVVLDLSIPLQT